MLVARANTVIDEDAVMIAPRNATPAHAAMLGSRRFEVLASSAHRARMEEGKIVRIPRHFGRVVSRRHAPRVCGCRQVKKEIGKRHGDGTHRLVQGAELRPSRREIEGFATEEEDEEEDLVW